MISTGVLSFLFVFLLLTFSITAAPRPKLLLLPLIPSADIEVDESEAVDAKLARAVNNSEAFQVDTIADAEKSLGIKPARRLLQCSDDTACLYKNLKRARYDLVIVGKVEIGGEDRREATFHVFNLNEREVKRTQRFKFVKGKMGSKRAARWAKALLSNPEELVDMDDSPDMEPEAVSVAPAPKPRSSAPALPSSDDVQEGIRQAAEAYLAGDAPKARKLIETIMSNPCRCNADRKAYTMKAMLDEFISALSGAQDALKKKNGAQAVSELEKLGGLDANIDEEARRLGLKSESVYSDRVRTWTADSYVILAQQQMNNWSFVAAKASLEKALQHDPKHETAKAELDKMISEYAPKLMRRANVAALSEPEQAIKFLKQVMELVGPDHKLFKQAKAKIEEMDE
jgi:hypothetical protein